MSLRGQSAQVRIVSPRTEGDFASWFIQDEHWSRAGLPLAAVLFLLAPLVLRGLGSAILLVYLQLPVYMLHQYEEHAHGAFQAAMNRMLPADRQLTDKKIFWLNILVVWGVDICVLYLAAYLSPAPGLVAPYLALVNSLVHIAPAIRQRHYNPGLWTALALFLPFGAYSVYAISRASHATLGNQGLALCAAILLHVLTFVVIRMRVERAPAR